MGMRSMNYCNTRLVLLYMVLRCVKDNNTHHLCLERVFQHQINTTNPPRVNGCRINPMFETALTPESKRTTELEENTHTADTLSYKKQPNAAGSGKQQLSCLMLNTSILRVLRIWMILQLMWGNTLTADLQRERE